MTAKKATEGAAAMARLGAIFCQLAVVARSKWASVLQAVKISQADELQSVTIGPSAAVRGLAFGSPPET